MTRPHKPHGRVQADASGNRILRIGLRAVVTGLAAAALLWSFSAFAYRQRTKPLLVTATRILQGETYDLESLRPVLAYLDKAEENDCAIARHAAVIRLYGAALAQGTSDGRGAMAKAEATTRSALACGPSDGYLWYSLFWIGYARNAPAAEIVPILEMSYRLTPNESWISQFRARVALQYFPDMGPDLQRRLEQEFSDLVRDGTRSAGSALRDADPETRALMLRIVAKLPLEERERFAKVLDSRDITIDIPGVDYSRWYGRKR